MVFLSEAKTTNTSNLNTFPKCSGPSPSERRILQQPPISASLGTGWKIGIGFAFPFTWCFLHRTTGSDGEIIRSKNVCLSNYASFSLREGNKKYDLKPPRKKMGERHIYTFFWHLDGCQCFEDHFTWQRDCIDENFHHQQSRPVECLLVSSSARTLNGGAFACKVPSFLPTVNGKIQKLCVGNKHEVWVL